MKVLLATALGSLGCAALAYLYWRTCWFYRNPTRTPPDTEGLVSPADGTVVYVKRVPPKEKVITIKKGVRAAVEDIARTDLESEKVLIGVFMSPFNVHYNRAPLSGIVRSIRDTPACGGNRCMGWMHLRTVLGLRPFQQNSLHLLQNQRKVTRIDGRFKSAPIHCYVVQIAARTVGGIDSYTEPGAFIPRSAIFGMIRIGSQVDLVVPWREDMRIQVHPGDRVKAGETVLID
ncbi:MAG: phosphatidylserine decarboxylase [Syntrophobacteraceae bacterium CG2_30_61_12]|nr:MAG: phosphatidylserine decarboxylase [Syntrophobacteraceae bacterium CG2_30_61_12]